MKILFSCMMFMVLTINNNFNSAIVTDLQLGNLEYSDNEVFKEIALFNSLNGAPKGHGSISMHKGHFVLIGGRDSGNPGGGFSFFDLSNPRNPQLVYNKYDGETFPMREAHGYGYTSDENGDFVAVQTISGFMIWDWTDLENPIRVCHVNVPGIVLSDYDNGNWWVHYQAPYIILGGSLNGIFIYNATDKANPFLVKHIPTSFYGGFRTGPVFALGNLLVATSTEGGGIATMDISNPAEPVLLDYLDGLNSYSWHLDGNRVLGAGTDGRLNVYDISDPTQITFVNRSEVLGGKGGYLTTQDDNVFIGVSDQAAKVDISNPAEYVTIGTASSDVFYSDEDFASSLGNLMFISNDHELGSILVPHQKGRDTIPPHVNAVNPKDGAIQAHPLTRIGISMTDNIDERSLDATTFIVRPVGGEPIQGRLSHQFGIINFAPTEPLASNTSYEVVIPSNGITDYVGNATETEFKSVFTTGEGVSDFSCSFDSFEPELVNEPVTFSIDVFGNSDDLSYEWDFGDNSPLEVSTSPTISHTYSEIGHYFVKVTLSRGQIFTTCYASQTIHLPILETSPAQSTSILQAANGDVWNVNPDNNTVTCIGEIDGVFSKKAEIVVGKKPRSIAQAPNGEIWVTNQADEKISVIDASQNIVIDEIELPFASQPFGIVFNPNGSAAYVSLYATGKLVQIDPTSRNITNETNVGEFARAISVSADGSKILVTQFISGATNGVVTEVDASNFNVSNVFQLAMDQGPDGATSGRGMPNYLSGIAISPDGNQAWVTGKKDNIQRGQFLEGSSLNFQNTVRAMTAVLDLNSGAEISAKRMDLNNSDSPKSIIFSSLGDYAMIALQGSNRVDIMDVFSQTKIASIDNVPSAPQGLTLDENGELLYVHSFLDRSVSIYNIADILQSNSTVAQFVTTIATVENEELTAQVLLGKKFFYNSSDPRLSEDSYISCASCHNDGEHDGRTYDFTQFGEGLRNTPSLVGRGGMQMGNVHWSANFDEIQDFEGQIRTLSNGDGLMDNNDFFSGTRSEALGDSKTGVSEDLDALAAYVASLNTFQKSPYRNQNGSLTSAAEQGRVIFQSLNCGSCHGGADFTTSSNGLMHDVGTIQTSSGQRLGEILLGLDAPTLRDLWQTAPYLHDGSAVNLVDVLTTKNLSQQHGEIQNLNTTEIDQLVEFLLQIDANEPEVNGDLMTLEIVAPAEGDSIDIDSTVVLSIETNLEDIRKVEFYSNGEIIGESFETPFEVEWNDLEEGTEKLQAKVYYSDHLVGAVSPTIQVTIVNLLPKLTNFCKDRFRVATAEIGQKYYTDRPYKIVGLSDELENSVLIRTPNNDKFNSQAAYLCFDVDKRVNVYVAYDPRVQNLPSWLEDWTRTELHVCVDELFIPSLDVYQKTFDAGSISLGGNLYQGGQGIQTNYAVMVKSAAQCDNVGSACDDGDDCTENDVINYECNCIGEPIRPSLETFEFCRPGFFTTTLEVGAKYYSDRPYKIVGVPESLIGGTLIKTKNAQKFNTQNTYLCYEADKAVEVYVAYDPRANVLPSWLNGWIATDMMICVDDIFLPTFDVYKKLYPAGEIKLGGNLYEGGNGSWTNYFAVVIPQVCDKVGVPCDDGNECTINDAFDCECNCVGEDICDGLVAGFDLSVFPNPFKNTINIKLDYSGEETQATVELYDIDGNPLYNTTIDIQQNLQVNTSNLPFGSYLVRATIGGLIQTKTVMKLP